MGGLIAGTKVVRMDEPCLSLAEVNLQSPGSKGWHRYMVLYVMRGDKPAEFRRDLGPAGKFKVDQFRIPGGWWEGGKYYVEHTVGELVDIADYLREGPYEAPAKPSPTDLIQGFHDMADKRRLHRKRRSMFCRQFQLQRGSM